MLFKNDLLFVAALVRSAAALSASEIYNPLSSAANVINLNISASGETYIVESDDTVASIAGKYGFGVCDLARLNILSDPRSIYPGEELRIPTAATFPYDTSCIAPNNTDTTSTCIYGGPHTYTTQEGDTLQKIANINFGITIESVTNQTAQTPYILDAAATPFKVLEAGQNVKIPVCANSSCTMSQFTLSYGTLQDFASMYSVTVGQLIAINTGYNHSEDVASLAMLHDCAIVAS
ncbi:hypothetical protein SEUCBS139899_005853 [Sporothrix eucalyptigena]|uniref:LysM domain-containing protein n=1 Tax=Sporothrix eucalyptigena TaxID=1812306 RepID=A0ABP0C9V7_9PEZI